jgi:hypothetical protein
MGHLWLADGYGTMTIYYEGLTHPVTGDFISVEITLPNPRMMVHCNMGGAGNGWYIDGIFDVGHMAYLPGNNIAPESYPEFSYSVNWMAPTPNQ